MKITLLESLYIAREISCDDFRTNSDLEGYEFDFLKGDIVETFLLTKIGNVYYTIKTKDGYILTDNVFISHDYISWIKVMKDNKNPYIKILIDLYNLIDISVQILINEYASK